MAFPGGPTDLLPHGRGQLAVEAFRFGVGCDEGGALGAQLRDGLFGAGQGAWARWRGAAVRWGGEEVG